MRPLLWIGRVVLALGWAWALLVLALFPGWPLALRITAVVVWVVTTWASWRLQRGAWRAATIAASIAAVGLWYAFAVRPLPARDWTPDQQKTPAVRFSADGRRVEVQNVRFATYRTAADYDVAWETRTYDLDRIRTVDFLVEPFEEWRGPAHTLLTFGFEDGEHVAVSAEIRKEKGESFSPLDGLFRHYEVAYVVGDERDLIGLRANVRRDPVYLFPIRATPEQVRELFISMLKRADGLGRRPEFYNTLTTTCTTSIVQHVNELRDEPISWWDPRVLFPGYSDELAYELGLIAFDGTLEEARRRFLINDRSAFGADGKAWSRQIRTLPPTAGKP
jgi:hypothetical protein